MMGLSMFLKRIRFERKLTSSECANRLGVTLPYYSSLESGKRYLTDKMFREFVELFKLTKAQARNLGMLSSTKKYIFTTKEYSKAQVKVLKYLRGGLEELDKNTCDKIIKLIKESVEFEETN